MCVPLPSTSRSAQDYTGQQSGQPAPASQQDNLAAVAPAGQAARRHTRRQLDGGPPILVAIVGGVGWRWSQLGMDNVSSSPQLQHALERAGADSRDPGGQSLVGFAIVRSWRPVQQSGCRTRACLKAALAREHRRCGPCFLLEHEVLRSCALEVPLSVSDCAMSGQAGCRQARLLESLCTRAIAVVPGECALPVGDILARWRTCFVLPETTFLWPAAPFFASGLAHGLISHDVSIVLAKNRKGIWVAPMQPSRRVRQEFLAKGQSAALQYEEARAQLLPAKRRRLGSQPEPFTAGELIATVRQAQHLKSQDRSRENARNVIANPLTGASALGLDIDAMGSHQPGGFLLRQARKRLDIAAMLWNRLNYVGSGPFFRFIACDASPQFSQSVEVFVTVERLIRREAISGKSMASVPGQELVSRTLPLVTLGAGKAGLIDKVASHVHQLFLEYGPSIGHVSAVCYDVRQVMSDMGTEFGISNFGKAVDRVLGGQLQWSGEGVPWSLPEAQEADRSQYLYPFAIQTPGLLHIVDWIIRSTVQQLPWWPGWQLQCKRLLQFCHGQAHRDRLRALFGELGQGDAASLNVATRRFAEWRWKTLSMAIKDLRRIAPVMRFLGMHLDRFAAKLGSRDTSGMKQLQATCCSPLFWDRAEAIGQLIQPLVLFMGWLQGCDCHEQELLAGQAISCPFKGCRARNLSSRLGLLRTQLHELRASLPGQGLAEGNFVSFAISHALASVNLKFMWVDELPYLVWKARWSFVSKRGSP